MQEKLYVRNLSFETTETELKDLFDQAGSVETVRIITDRDTGRSKGFGFVEMREGGDKAICPDSPHRGDGPRIWVGNREIKREAEEAVWC